jgi:hypothetical protein
MRRIFPIIAAESVSNKKLIAPTSVRSFISPRLMIG